MAFGKKKVQEVASSVIEASDKLKIPIPVKSEEEKKALYEPESFSAARNGVFEAEVCTLLVGVIQRLDALADRLDAQGKQMDSLIEVAKG